MRRVWRFTAWIAGVAVVIALIMPFVTTSLTNQPDGKAAPAAGDGKGKGKHGVPDGPTPVLVATSRQADVPVYVEGVGTGKALNSVLIRSQVDGALMTLNFTEGQTVKAGDLIAKIDPRLYQATLDQNVAKKAQDEAILANAKRDLDRYAMLIKTKAATQQQYDTQVATVAQDQAQVAIDQALIDSSRTTLGYTDIKSPIDGRTGIRNVDVGNLIHATDTTGIVTVAQIQPISVIFNVPQQELPRINKASLLNQLDVQATDSSGSTVIDHGALAVIDNTIDQTTGTVKLRANFSNPQLQLWPGIFVNVRLLVETLHDAIVVPVAAVQHGPTGAFVFTVVDDKAKMRPVTIGQQDDEKAVLTKGLSANEVVITSGFQKLTDGAKVKTTADTSLSSAGSASTALHEPGVSPPAPEAGAADAQGRDQSDRHPGQKRPSTTE